MAIALDATSSGSQTYGVGSCTVAHTCTGANLDLLCVIHTTATSADIVTGVTYNGVAMTRKHDSTFGLGLATGYLYELKNPATGTHNVVASMSNTTAQCNVDNVSYTGIDQTAGVESVSTAYNNSSATSPNSQSVTGTVGSLVLDIIAGTTTDAFTLGGGQTSIINASNASGGQYAISSKTASTTSTAMSETWSGGSRQLMHLVASLKAVVTNPPPTFGGPNIPTLNLSQNVAMSPVDLSTRFGDSDTILFSKSPAGTTWPAGLALSLSGTVSGTITTAGTTSGIKLRATDTASQTVDSNAFDVVVSSTAPLTWTDTVFTNGVAAANATGIVWTLHSAKGGTLLDSGNSGAISSGSMTLSFPGAAAAGKVAGNSAYLTFTNDNGDPAQSPPPKSFSATITLAA